MKALLVLFSAGFSAGALVAGRAYAAPCDVAIVRAPDDVRTVVERWLDAETCVVSLEVRIMPVPEGYYVIALDQRQRVRERIVPDAQSAGVLVASWAADDSLPMDSISVELSWTPPKSPAASATPLHIDAAPPAPSPAPRLSRDHGNTFALAGTLIVAENAHGMGLRSELDLGTRGRWRYGAAAAFARSDYAFRAPSYTGEMRTFDFEAMGYLAHVRSSGRWQLRGAIAAGLILTHRQGSLFDDSYMHVASPKMLHVFPVADASLAVGIAVNDRWLITTGPLVSWVVEDGLKENESAPETPGRGVQLMWLVGVRRGL